MGDAQAIVDGVLAAYPLAGLSLGVVTREGLTESVQRGIARDVRPIELDTVFRIGSVTKTMTALALLQQWDAGRFDLDDPVNDHLVDLELVGRPEWRAATFRHLLTHTAGIGELAAWSDLRRPMFGLATPVGGAVARAPERYGGRVQLDVEPGTKWAYANHGFNVLGYLVESMGGAPYAEHLRSVLFDPLGMDHTDVVRSARVVDRLATGYVNRRRGLHSPRDVDVETQAAGSVFSTLPDMATFAAALLDGGRGIVKPDTLGAAFEPHYRPCPTHPGIGLSFFRDDLGGHLAVGHGGGLPGFVTALAIAPDEGVGVVAFTNGGGQSLAIAARRTLCALLGVAPGGPGGRPLRPERWADLVGYYRPDPGPLTNARVVLLGGGLEVVVREQQLVLRGLSPLRALRRGVPMVPADDDGNVYVVDLAGAGMPPMAIHVERNAGEPVALHCGGLVAGAYPALRQTSSWKNPRRALGIAGAGVALAVGARRVSARRRCR